MFLRNYLELYIDADKVGQLCLYIVLASLNQTLQYMHDEIVRGKIHLQS